MAENEKEGDGGRGEKASSTGAILGVLLASVIAAGGGVYLGWSQFGKHEPAQHGSKDAHGKAGDAEKYTDGSRVRDLQPRSGTAGNLQTTCGVPVPRQRHCAESI